MSTAAHEPRRVGPRRSDSPTGSKVTPRRNAPDTSEPHALQYDSDELPVLIRLPNLCDTGAAETRPASRTQRKTNRIDRGSASKQRAAKQKAPQVAKKSFQQRAGDNKLVVGGIVGGILVIVVLFVFNSGSTPPGDQDGWASEAAAIEPPVEGLEVVLPDSAEPTPPFPGFAYGSPSEDTQQTPIEAPRLQQYPARQLSETAALPNNPTAAVAWPSEEAMGSQSASGSQPESLWPGEALSLEQGGYEYPAADSTGQTDFRSSMYPPEAESYRMGKLESDRQQATEGGRSSILNGNIEIPDTTSLR